MLSIVWYNKEQSHSYYKKANVDKQHRLNKCFQHRKQWSAIWCFLIKFGWCLFYFTIWWNMLSECLHLNSSSWFFCHLSRCRIRAYFLNWKISQVTPNLTNLPNFLHCSKEPMSSLTASFGLFFNHLAVMGHKTCLAILVWCALWRDTIIFFLVHL